MTNITGWKIRPDDVVDGYTILLAGAAKVVIKGEVIFASGFDQIKLIKVENKSKTTAVATITYSHRTGTGQAQPEISISQATFNFVEDTVEF